MDDTQCGGREACKNDECRTRCKTSDDCMSAGDKCDDHGLCAQCVSSQDCPAVYHCTSGACVLDICEGDVVCSSSLDAILTCSAEGDTFEQQACLPGQGCFVTAAKAQCHARNCTPGERSCDRSARYAELCGTDGIALAERIDCTERAQFCADGECVDRLCDPGRLRCGSGGVMRCDALGASESLVEVCGAGDYCDPANVGCAARVCEPGTLSCQGEVVSRCDDAGTAWLAQTDCVEQGGLCWEGKCLPRVCTAPLVCKDGSSYACVDNSTRLELASSCASGESSCDEATGQCRPNACRPGSPICNGDSVTSCKADGSGPSDDGIDCSASGKVCWAADCRPSICSNPFECRNGDLYRCENRGTALTLDRHCEAGTVCDSDAGTCRSQKCVPQAPSCDGDVATICDASGLGFEAARRDCASSGLTCANGDCLPIVCAPNTQYCEANELRRCGSTGATFELLDACSPSEYCDSTQPVCLPDVCSASTPICNSNMATSCKADGSGPVTGGVNCADRQQVCERGVCRDVVCASSQTFCSSVSGVSVCNGLGTAWAPLKTCSSGDHCAPNASGADCVANLCNPGGNACAGERLAVCNADGSGYASQLDDCSSKGLVCDLGGSCQTNANDSSSSNSFASSSGAAYHFVIFRALTARRLAAFRLGLALDEAANLTWLMYEGDGMNGPYAPLQNGSALAITTASSGELVSSSGLLGTIDAGKYYLIGVGVPGSHAVFRNSGAVPISFSFGQVLGSFSFPGPSGETKLAAPSSVEIGVNEVDSALWATLSSSPP